MSKFTPGPWVWGDGYDGLDSPSGPVLRYEPYEGMWLSMLNGDKDANARLIAAAPDAYQLLADIQRNWASMSNGAAFATAYSTRFAPAVAALLARIEADK